MFWEALIMRKHRPLSAYELGMYAAPFLTQGNLDAARVGLSDLVRPWAGHPGQYVESFGRNPRGLSDLVRPWAGHPGQYIESLGPNPSRGHMRRFGRLACASDCECEDCSSARLGALGVVAPGTTVTGSVVSAGVAAGVSVGVNAAAGAELGSVAGPIGTVAGAVVGYLTSKLFGQADYAAIYSQVSNSIALAEAYAQVAGKYPGRLYGWLEMQYIWSGLVHYGVFPQNYNAGGVLGSNPGLAVCSESSISHNINACGVQSWINDLVLGSGTKAIQPQIERANLGGVYNPEQVWSSYVEPVWNGPVECSGCVDWFLPKNARAGMSSLVEQLVIDTIDAIEFNSNACLALYYGTIPAGWQCGCESGCAGAPTAPASVAQKAPTAATAGDAVRAVTPALAAAAQGCSPASLSGASISAGGGQTLCDPSGNTWSFGSAECNSRTCQGTEILLNGASTGGFANELAFIDGQIVAQSELATSAWSGGAWVPLSTACVGAPAGYTQIGTDTSGNPVYENANGVLYECSGTQMVMFSGDLDLSSGPEPAQALQSIIQGDMAAGQSLELATQNALASITQTGTALTPDILSGVTSQVAQTYQAPATVPAAVSTPGGLDATTLMIGAGVLLLGGLTWWALSRG
jgi:hypothetical protein